MGKTMRSRKTKLKRVRWHEGYSKALKKFWEITDKTLGVDKSVYEDDYNRWYTILNQLKTSDLAYLETSTLRVWSCSTGFKEALQAVVFERAMQLKEKHMSNTVPLI